MELRQKEKKWSCAYWRRQGGGELEIDLSVEFPPVRTFEEKSEIIHQWQATMNPENLTRGVCAVCAQEFKGCLLYDVMLNEQMLVLLQNECLPVKTLPSMYDFQLYHCAVLQPRGMFC